MGEAEDGGKVGLFERLFWWLERKGRSKSEIWLLAMGFCVCFWGLVALFIWG